MKSEDRPRIGRHAWVDYLGQNPFPETVLKRISTASRRIAEMQKDVLTPATRLADNAMAFNPAAVGGMVQLMWGAGARSRRQPVERAAAVLRSRSPPRRRAGGCGRAGLGVEDDRTVVTLVNVSRTTPRTVVVQGGGWRAPDSFGGRERENPVDQRARFHGAARAGRGREADAGDEALRESPNGEVPLGQIGLARTVEFHI